MEWRFYELLRDLWKKELETEALQKIPVNLYRQGRELISSIRNSIDNSVGELERKIIEEEIRVLQDLMESLFRIRIKKIIESFIANNPLPLDALTPEEKSILTTFKAQFNTSLAEILGTHYQHSERIEKEGSEYVLIRFIRKCPEFVGVDGLVYGPFEPEDIARVPRDNAEALISRKVAVKIAT